MHKLRTTILFIGLCLIFSGCNEMNDIQGLEECRVAVILPFSDGMEQHWKQCLALCSSNMQKASERNGSGIKLVFDFYDEDSPNLTEIINSVAKDNNITAVIGGLYSAKAIEMANVFSKANKPFFTTATTEQLVRAYSSWGNLWAMAESDITQCEVLLSKAMQYGADSVALIADKNSAYGQTFINWFAFQAMEFGLGCTDIYSYDGDLVSKAEAATGSNADFLICAPSSISDLKEIIKAYRKSKNHHLRLLCSDIAYGTNSIAQLGQYAEGIEGVSYGSDPETGFDLAYQAYFGMEVSIGEAQIYDAAMLIGYAQYLRRLNKDLSFKNAMRRLVSGRDAVNVSWRAEDMAQILFLLEHGEYPDVAGASGSLDFDAKVFTNVLSTTYYNYLIYNKHYITLDYNSTEGSRRAEPTLAEWNWKASQMQDIEDTSSIVRKYPELDQRWALLVATSEGWENYRHQVDVLNIYQQLKMNGYDDNHIILIIEDDLAYNPNNPNPGVLVSRMGAPNVYHDLEIDYKTSDISPSAIGDILAGNSSVALPHVINADSCDNIFIFWSGHGVPGALCWLDNSYGITTSAMDNILTNLEANHKYRKITGCIETCYSGSVFSAANDHDGMLFLTAANAQETSKADEYNYEIDVWMSNRFSATLQDCMANTQGLSMRDLYYRLFQSTVGSHVSVYGIYGYGSLYSTFLDEEVL